MEFREFAAKTVDDAITEATISLSVTSDKIEYEVVTEGSKGFFGAFAKPAVIRARIREEKPEVKEEVKQVKEAPVKKEVVKEPAKEVVKAAPAKKEVPVKKEAPAPEKKAEVKAPKSEKNPEETKAVLTQFLTDVLDKMDMPGEVKVKINDAEKVIDINIEGNSGDIIGKRGQTLDALQYLASIVANKEEEEYYRLKLDTKNYRARRAKTLENLAKNVATKVKKTKRKVVLEPMNPYERRIIHAYLQSDSQVTTKSEGEEPNRRVVVYFKR